MLHQDLQPLFLLFYKLLLQLTNPLVSYLLVINSLVGQLVDFSRQLPYFLAVFLLKLFVCLSKMVHCVLKLSNLVLPIEDLLIGINSLFILFDQHVESFVLHHQPFQKNVELFVVVLKFDVVHLDFLVHLALDELGLRRSLLNFLKRFFRGLSL